MKNSDANIITLAQKLGEVLQKNKLSCVTAESCTGGGLAYAITSIPGSSEWFDRGFVVYSNLSKTELLGIPSDIIEKYGAVSKETAIHMAEGALKNSKADIAISTTGIAGPEGGSLDKPVGTVWFGLARKNQKAQTLCQVFSGDRKAIREASVCFAFEWLLHVFQ